MRNSKTALLMHCGIVCSWMWCVRGLSLSLSSTQYVNLNILKSGALAQNAQIWAESLETISFIEEANTPRVHESRRTDKITNCSNCIQLSTQNACWFASTQNLKFAVVVRDIDGTNMFASDFRCFCSANNEDPTIVWNVWTFFRLPQTSPPASWRLRIESSAAFTRLAFVSLRQHVKQYTNLLVLFALCWCAELSGAHSGNITKVTLHAIASEIVSHRRWARKGRETAHGHRRRLPLLENILNA